jgi:hypothetical protein
MLKNLKLLEKDLLKNHKVTLISQFTLRFITLKIPTALHTPHSKDRHLHSGTENYLC